MRRIRTAFILWITLSAAFAQAWQAEAVGSLKGALVLAGGGANRPVFIQEFVRLAGGSDAKLVVIPTTLEDEDLTAERLDRLQRRSREIFGTTQLAILHTRDRKLADSPAFVEPLRQATGVWIMGGNEHYLMQAYGDTQTEKEIKSVVARGGVLGGTSAGAVIQGSILLAGEIIPARDGHGEGTAKIKGKVPSFGLIPGVFVVPHWRQRKIHGLISGALAVEPGIMVIGIDESTAVVVQGSRMKVLGDGQVGIFDGKDEAGGPRFTLSAGQVFDLKSRRISAE